MSECWCGMKGKLYFAPVPAGGCGGLGTIECLCGGDLCVCHNHGEVQCPGCEECEGSDDDGGPDDEA